MCQTVDTYSETADNAQHNTLAAEDQKILSQNKKLEMAHERLGQMQTKVINLTNALNSLDEVRDSPKYGRAQGALSKAVAAEEKAHHAYDKDVDVSKVLRHTGSGKIGILLPTI